MLYFLMSFSIEKFQLNKTHIGIKKAVKSTKRRLKPSVPKDRLKLEKKNQSKVVRS